MSQFDPTDTRSQERAQADAELRAKKAQESEDADFRWLMGSNRGRRIVWKMLDRAGAFRLSFNTDPLAMAFNEGRKNEGLRILAQIHTLCPELYPVMVMEQQTNERNTHD
jgi:hypothetical protein